MSLRSCKGLQSGDSTAARSSPRNSAATTVARYRQADRHCSLACVGRLDSSASSESSSILFGYRLAYRMGTGAKRMIEPLPLALSEVSPEVSALLWARKLLRAFRVVMPISKQ